LYKKPTDIDTNLFPCAISICEIILASHDFSSRHLVCILAKQTVVNASGVWEGRKNKALNNWRRRQLKGEEEFKNTLSFGISFILVRGGSGRRVKSTDVFLQISRFFYSSF
jgi:hypothetical protein